MIQERSALTAEKLKFKCPREIRNIGFELKSCKHISTHMPLTIYHESPTPIHIHDNLQTA